VADQQFPEPTVDLFIINQQGELLLLQSHKWPGAYVVPGGHVELGERIEEAAIREAKEETGPIHSAKSARLSRYGQPRLITNN